MRELARPATLERFALDREDRHSMAVWSCFESLAAFQELRNSMPTVTLDLYPGTEGRYSAENAPFTIRRSRLVALTDLRPLLTPHNHLIGRRALAGLLPVPRLALGLVKVTLGLNLFQFRVRLDYICLS